MRQRSSPPFKPQEIPAEQFSRDRDYLIAFVRNICVMQNMTDGVKHEAWIQGSLRACFTFVAAKHRYAHCLRHFIILWSSQRSAVQLLQSWKRRCGKQPWSRRGWGWVLGGEAAPTEPHGSRLQGRKRGLEHVRLLLAVKVHGQGHPGAGTSWSRKLDVQLWPA